MNDIAPAARWDIDLLSEEGVERMTEVAGAVKTMVTVGNINGKILHCY
jgi:hypothetical protein